MNAMPARLPTLLLIAAGLGGCASVRPPATAEAPRALDPHILPIDTASATPAGNPAVAALPACPPSDAAYRVRDLTRPWHDRVYLLPDGGTCRPGGTP